MNHPDSHLAPRNPRAPEAPAPAPTRLTQILLTVLILSVTWSANGAEAKVQLVSRPGSRIVITGSNNLHEWQVKGDVIDGAVDCGRGFPLSTNETPRIGEVQGTLEGSIPVRSLHYDWRRLDRTLYRSLREQTNPYLLFRFDNLKLTRRPKPGDASFLFEADSELVAAGATNLSEVSFSVRPLPGGQLEISGTLNLKLSDFQIEPPEAGNDGDKIITRDEVQARFDWRVGPPEKSAHHAPKTIPPFVVEGSISTSNRFSCNAADFFFFSSNGWWQVVLTNISMPPSLASQNCMRIPEGVRSYVQFHNSTATCTASASPIDFPPPGIGGGMFETWLSLCPNPALPIIDATRMHRFLIVPAAPFDLLKKPFNVGQYQARYLEPGGAFLSELVVTNDGVRIDWNPGGDEIRRYLEPFDNGFKELELRVLVSTNLNGIAFPLKAVVNYFGISAEDRRQLEISMSCEIQVARISFAPADFAKQVHPKQLFGMDFRPRRLPGSQAVNRTITDDQWPASSP